MDRYVVFHNTWKRPDGSAVGRFLTGFGIAQEEAFYGGVAGGSGPHTITGGETYKDTLADLERWGHTYGVRFDPEDEIMDLSLDQVEARGIRIPDGRIEGGRLVLPEPDGRRILIYCPVGEPMLSRFTEEYHAIRGRRATPVAVDQDGGPAAPSEES